MPTLPLFYQASSLYSAHHSLTVEVQSQFNLYSVRRCHLWHWDVSTWRCTQLIWVEKTTWAFLLAYLQMSLFSLHFLALVTVCVSTSIDFAKYNTFRKEAPKAGDWSSRLWHVSYNEADNTELGPCSRSCSPWSLPLRPWLFSKLLMSAAALDAPCTHKLIKVLH